jgi:hypothetical protein
VAGCKQLDWDEPRRLIDVGLSTNTWSDRFAMIDLDEQDQGQYDDRTDSYAVNTAGMLVRRDVWDKLGGFDPALPGPGDDIDFCARVRLAGHRVVVVPEAKMLHVAHRPQGQGTSTAARKAAVYTRLKHAPAWQVPFLAVGAFLTGIYRLFAGFLLKAPGHAVTMFAATCAGLVRPVALARGRSALAKTRVQPRSAHKALMASGRDVRLHVRSLREAAGPDDEPAGTGASLLSLEPTGDAMDDIITPLDSGRTPALVGAVALVAALLILSMIALSRFIGASALTGGGLLPVSAGLGQIWSHATDWWVSLGSGLPGHGDPFNFVLWLVAAVGFGNGSAAVAWLLILAVPLSGFTAWLASGALSWNRWPRLVAALVWAGAPVLQVAIGQGRLGALLAHVLIPLVMLGMIRATGGGVGTETANAGKPGTGKLGAGKPGTGGIPSWTAAAAAGLGLAAVTASAPSLLPIAVIGVLVATVFLGRRGKTLWWSLVPSLALFLPFVFSALNNPRALLADPGVPLADNPGPLWQQLLGFPLNVAPGDGIPKLDWFGANAPWAWIIMFAIGTPLVLTALVALVLPLRRAGTVRALWLVALLSLAGAYAGSRIAVALGLDTLVTPFNGPAVSVALFALLGAAVLGFDAVYRSGFGSSGSGPATHDAGANRPARTVAVVLSAILVLAPAASLAVWTAQNLAGGNSPVAATSLGTLPATASDRGTGPDASRTLVLRVGDDSTVQATLMQGAGTTLDSLSTIAAAVRIDGRPGEEKVAAPDAASATLRQAVAEMLANSGIDPRPRLVQLGVGFVVLQNGDTAAELLANQLEAVPGMDTVGPTDAGWLWRVTPTYKAGSADVVSRVRLVNANGTALGAVPSAGTGVDTTLAAGSAGRKVVLAERFDAGWSAWLDGKQLTAVQQNWAQAFELPASGGHLEIRYVQPWAPVFVLAQIVLLALTLLLAIPVRARRGRIGAFRDEASLQKVGRGV